MITCITSKAKNIFITFLIIFLLLAGCKTSSQQQTPDIPTLVYANLSKNSNIRSLVNKFNTAHAGEVRIEVRNYFEEDGWSGRERLLAEMAAGHGPDILDLRDLPYRALVQQEYLEDLWPYIESDPDLGRESILEAPFRAAEVDGGLYTLFDKVYVHTLVGAESVTGARYSWTLEELLKAFSHMPADSTILEYYYDKDTAFYYVFRMVLDSYVDWETGECFFDSEQFRSSLEFVNSFPLEFEWTSSEEVNAEVTERILNERQMLAFKALWRPIDLQFLDAIYGQGGRASLIGYPMADGSPGSTYYLPHNAYKMAMSSTCADKEAGWALLRELLLPQYANFDDEKFAEKGPEALPVNRKDYERLIRFDSSSKNTSKMSQSLYNGPTVQYHAATEGELARYEDFLGSIDKIEICDNTLYSLVKECCNPYFAGDKTLDETIQLIQNRVGLYVNELR